MAEKPLTLRFMRSSWCSRNSFLLALCSLAAAQEDALVAEEDGDLRFMGLLLLELKQQHNGVLLVVVVVVQGAWRRR